MADETEATTPEDVSEESPAEVADETTEVTDATESTPVTEGLTLGDSAPAEDEPRVASVIRGKIDTQGVAIGTGRRKTAVARVRIKDGDGKLTINGRELDAYFAADKNRKDVVAPLRATDMLGKVDVWVRVNGGGTTGQAGAIVLGVARALQAKDPTLHHILSTEGYLTRDGRMVERKKYGYKKARRSFQFSKR